MPPCSGRGRTKFIEIMSETGIMRRRKLSKMLRGDKSDRFRGGIAEPSSQNEGKQAATL